MGAIEVTDGWLHYDTMHAPDRRVKQSVVGADGICESTEATTSKTVYTHGNMATGNNLSVLRSHAHWPCPAMNPLLLLARLRELIRGSFLCARQRDTNLSVG